MLFQDGTPPRSTVHSRLMVMHHRGPTQIEMAGRQHPLMCFPAVFIILREEVNLHEDAATAQLCGTFRNYATLHLPSAKREPSLSFFQHLATRVQSENGTATSSLLALNQVEVVSLNEGCGTKRWQRAANTPSTCRQAWTKNAWPELKTSMPWESLLHPLVITRLTMHVATCNAAAKPGSATGQSKP